MLVDLADATIGTCGNKAASLALLARSGMPVPDGFVVPFDGDVSDLAGVIADRLAEMGDPPVAVRSSATGEDGPGASAAGQYESVLAVRGGSAVAAAALACRASFDSPRAIAYRGGVVGAERRMAVIVQRMLDADAAGVMFTPTHAGDDTLIEASFGLALAVVGGSVEPDRFRVAGDGSITRRIGRKAIRFDVGDHGVEQIDVPEQDRARPVMDDTAVVALAALGHRIAAVLGAPQDIEWVMDDGQPWIVQARPITAPLPPHRSVAPTDGVLVGTPGSAGVAGGVARVLHGPSDFGRLRPGDVLVCRYTDPAWTPLFRVAGAVVTETGGALSHAAIVAREYGLPAVLGLPRATEVISDGTRVTVDGTGGLVRLD